MCGNQRYDQIFSPPNWNGFDDRIISLYAGGMTLEEIRGHLAEIYGITVSKDFISTVTDKVLDDVRAWQNRPIDECYLVLWIDRRWT